MINYGLCDSSHGPFRIDNKGENMSVNTQVMFTPYEIKDCLFDKERTKNLKNAINATVKPGDVVLEAGGGTGILSMFALQAGAKHAYIIELQERFCTVIREIAMKNGFADRITVICGDATATDMPEQVDVYISELLCTGLFNEPQVQAYNNLRKFVKPGGLFIPQKVISSIKFAQAAEYAYDIQINCDSYLAEDITHKELTTSKEYMSIVFDGDEVETFIDSYGEVLPIGLNGVINSGIISTRAMLTNKIMATKTKFLFNPELLFIDSRVNVDSNTDSIEYILNYECGCDTRNIKLKVF
jgi:predicted RNA methylase